MAARRTMLCALTAGLLTSSALAAQGVRPTTLPSPRAPIERRMPAPPPSNQSTLLRDAQYARRAMQLTALQEKTMANVRAHYAPTIQAYVAKLNALADRNAPRDAIAASEDTLRTIILAEHAALDSLLTPQQKQRFQDAMRQAHALAPARSGRS